MPELEEISIPVALDTRRLEADMQRMTQLSRRFSAQMSRTFADAILSGRRFSDVLREIGMSLARMALTSALKPVFGALGNTITSAFSSLPMTAFARGGVIDAPAMFTHSGGLGLAGEAGPEAILPLARGPDGRLGVRAAGDARPVQVVMNISTPDAEGFRRNRGLISAELARAIAESRRHT